MSQTGPRLSATLRARIQLTIALHASVLGVLLTPIVPASYVEILGVTSVAVASCHAREAVVRICARSTACAWKFYAASLLPLLQRAGCCKTSGCSSIPNAIIV